MEQRALTEEQEAKIQNVGELVVRELGAPS